MKVGYYLFLGHGDYHPPDAMNKQWVASWDLDDWKRMIDQLVALKITTILLYLNGHRLPYKSQMYPDLVDSSHPNCQNEFLPELLEYIQKCHLETIAVLTTTGHAGVFGSLMPESVITLPKHDVDIEHTLCSFPLHMRRGKLEKKQGAAQLGHGVLCHNKSIAQQYAKKILQEVLTRYGRYFSGVALHPPESAYPCECATCNELFFQKYRAPIYQSDPRLVRSFFIETYLVFQNNQLFPIIDRLLPKTTKIMFTIPWLFESSWQRINHLIPPEVTLIEWDYNLEPDRVLSLRNRLLQYLVSNRKLWFMPSAGFSFDDQKNIPEQIEAVLNQVRTAIGAGASAVIYFLGARSSAWIHETRMIEEEPSSQLTNRYQ